MGLLLIVVVLLIFALIALIDYAERRAKRREEEENDARARSSHDHLDDKVEGYNILFDRVKRATAPWTDDQVASLNAYQNAGYVHPFTHGSGDDKVDLIATRDGWIARNGGPVVQDWAHACMADWSWRMPEFEQLRASSEQEST